MNLYTAEPASREENDRLYPQVVAGHEPAIERMILSNMAYVTIKVGDYLRQFPTVKHLKEDLLASGYLAVTEAVRSMVGKTVENPNPSSMIWVRIHFALGEMVDYEATIRVPQRTYLRKKAAGEELDIPEKEYSIDVEHTFQQDANSDPRSLVDLRDELAACCTCEAESEIVRLREEGRTDAEIAEILEIPKSTTYMMRRGIYERFLNRNPGMRGEV